jgi:hypothetical protein
MSCGRLKNVVKLDRGRLPNCHDATCKDTQGSRSYGHNDGDIGNSIAIYIYRSRLRANHKESERSDAQNKDQPT